MVAHNPFARDQHDLTGAEEAVAAPALRAARTTFPTFQDDPSSHYYRARDRSPEETWDAITVEVARVTAIAAAKAERGAKRREGALLDPSDFQAMHQAIFEPVFGDRTLAMRQYEEQAEYGIVLGPRDKPVHRRQDGISGRALSYRLKALANDLNEAIRARDSAVARGIRRRTITTTTAAAQGFGRLLANHPWYDGNGRTAFVLLNFALVRMGLLMVAIRETQDFHWCLGKAMHRGHRDVAPLATYLRDLIAASENGA
jgi:prophage maintenance system killer protein